MSLCRSQPSVGSCARFSTSPDVSKKRSVFERTAGAVAPERFPATGIANGFSDRCVPAGPFARPIAPLSHPQPATDQRSGRQFLGVKPRAPITCRIVVGEKNRCILVTGSDSAIARF
jgi:hypothetical protein